MPGGDWPGGLPFVEIGYVLYLVSAKTSGTRTATDTLDAFSGLRLAAGARYLLAHRWALVASGRVEFLPRYPTLAWHGESAVRRGPWRGAIEAGAAYGF